MIAADRPVQRPRDARLLVVDAHGRITHAPRSRFVDFLRAGRSRDRQRCGDAAREPARRARAERRRDRSAARRRCARSAADDVHTFSAVVFGAGDFRTRTEDRPLPPPWRPAIGSCSGRSRRRVEARSLDHPAPRCVVRFDGSRSPRCGRASRGTAGRFSTRTCSTPLALWDVWTPIAGAAGRLRAAVGGLRARLGIDPRDARARIAFATITLAAGISSTGDAELDRRLPFDEPYRIPEPRPPPSAARERTGGRIVAIGTTVVRALEHAAARDGVVRAGDGVADQRLGPASRLRIVDAILSGTHEPDSSHYQLLRAFMDDDTLAEASAALEAHGLPDARVRRLGADREEVKTSRLWNDVQLIDVTQSLARSQSKTSQAVNTIRTTYNAEMHTRRTENKSGRNNDPRTRRTAEPEHGDAANTDPCRYNASSQSLGETRNWSRRQHDPRDVQPRARRDRRTEIS